MRSRSSAPGTPSDLTIEVRNRHRAWKPSVVGKVTLEPDASEKPMGLRRVPSIGVCLSPVPQGQLFRECRRARPSRTGARTSIKSTRRASTSCTVRPRSRLPSPVGRESPRSRALPDLVAHEMRYFPGVTNPSATAAEIRSVRSYVREIRAMSEWHHTENCRRRDCSDKLLGGDDTANRENAREGSIVKNFMRSCRRKGRYVFYRIGQPRSERDTRMRI